MNIGGLATMTLLDYPGKVAATIFTSGCNFLCPFCHNADLVITNNIHNTPQSFTEEDVLLFLQKRKKLLGLNAFGIKFAVGSNVSGIG